MGIPNDATRVDPLSVFLHETKLKTARAEADKAQNILTSLNWNSADQSKIDKKQRKIKKI